MGPTEDKRICLFRRCLPPPLGAGGGSGSSRALGALGSEPCTSLSDGKPSEESIAGVCRVPQRGGGGAGTSGCVRPRALPSSSRFCAWRSA